MGKMKVREFICPTCKKGFQRHRKIAGFCSHSCAMVWRENPDHKRRTAEEKIERGRSYARNKWNEKCDDPKWRKEKLEATKRYNRELRLSVMMAYGGLSCSCDHHGEPCGPKPIEFLALDHIGGNGKENGRATGYTHYRNLRNLGYPPGYRVLCHNCNASLGFYGRCPMSDTETQQRWKTSPGNKKVRVLNQLCT